MLIIVAAFRNMVFFFFCVTLRYSLRETAAAASHFRDTFVRAVGVTEMSPIEEESIGLFFFFF